MTRTALILGASGRFGRNMAHTLRRHGWNVGSFDREKDRLPDAANGVDLIVNGWNPDYSRWADEVPGLTRKVISAARASGAAVLIPGNVYVYGPDLPEIVTSQTPHRSQHPLGRIRRAMERAYEDAGIRTLVLRAGDYLDTEASGNWFDAVVARKLARGRISYPGPLDRKHAWAFLHDLAEAGACLADNLDSWPDFSEVLFPGYALTGAELAHSIQSAIGRPARASTMSWLPIQVARPFWPAAKHLLEMRYLWQRPHGLRDNGLADLAPDYKPTPMLSALQQVTVPLLQNSTSTQTSRWSEA